MHLYSRHTCSAVGNVICYFRFGPERGTVAGHLANNSRDCLVPFSAHNINHFIPKIFAEPNTTLDIVVSALAA